MLSCLPVSLFGDIISGKMTVADWSRLAKQQGLDGFDITISFLRDRTPAGIKAMREQINAGGLPCITMSIYSDLTDMRENAFEKELIRAKSDIACAADLGVRTVRITAGQFYPQFDEKRQLDQAIAGIKEAKETADRFGVSLVWENHSKPGAWENPDYNYDHDRVIKMADALKNSGIGLNFDVANAYLTGHGADLLKRYYPDVRSIHLNDVSGKDPIKFCGVFTGLVPIEESLKVLCDNGFDGVISIEEAAFEGVEGLKKYVRVTKQKLKEYDLI